jgi:hypothetical protein
VLTPGRQRGHVIGQNKVTRISRVTRFRQMIPACKGAIDRQEPRFGTSQPQPTRTITSAPSISMFNRSSE